MRSTVISVILFFLLVGGVALNGFFVRDVSDTLTQRAEALEEPSDEKLNSLEAYWSGSRPWLELSISDSYLDSVEKAIIAMRSAYELGEEKEYMRQLALFRQAAKSVKKAEQISLRSIL